MGRSDSLQQGEEPIYQDPAEDEAALYEQYHRINIKYIQKDQIRYLYDKTIVDLNNSSVSQLE